MPRAADPRALTPQVDWHAAGLSDIGSVRARNEDCFVVEHDLGLYAVADGLGGHQGGDVASRLACDTLVAALGEGAALEEAIARSNTVVLDAAQDDPALYGMGTTLSALVLDEPDTATVAQVGDSRVYLARGGALVQVTEDQTVGMDMVRQGTMSVDEARSSRGWNSLTQALGTDVEIAPVLATIDLREAGMVLLCSDGLSEMVPDALIEGLLADSFSDPAAAAAGLVRAALDRGGRDNVTVVVLVRAA